jgi:hypothetical protein
VQGVIERLARREINISARFNLGFCGKGSILRLSRCWAIYHNVVTMTKALERLGADGYTFDEALVSCVSPYQTEHINRFGRYGLKRDRVPEPLDSVGILRMPPRQAGSAAAAKAAV